MVHFPALTRLDLGGCGGAVTGGLGPLANNTRLNDLRLGYTQVTGGLGPLANLTELTELSLGGTQVT